MPNILFQLMILIALLFFLTGNMFYIYMVAEKDLARRQSESAVSVASMLAALAWAAFALIGRAVWL